MPNAVSKQPPQETETWLSQRQAALALGITTHTVLSHALAGELESMKLGGRWFFSRKSVDALAATLGA